MNFRERIISIDRRRVGDIAHNPRNPKRYTDSKNERLTAVIDQYGKVGVLLTYFDPDGIERFFDGNTRKRLDPNEVWYIAQTDLTQAEVNDLVMLYDPLALPEWDAGILDGLLGETAVSGDLLTGMLAGVAVEAGLDWGSNGAEESQDAEPQTNRAEELQEIWQVQPGDLWRLPSRTAGHEHRLVCGDCTDRGVVERVMGGERANGCFTSPPYAEQRKSTYGGIAADRYVDWWEGVQTAVREVLAEDGSFFVNIKPHCEDGQRSLYVFDMVLAMVRQWGWVFVDELCWRNTKNGVPGTWPNRLKNAFEPVYHFSKQAAIKFRPMAAGHGSNGVFDYHPLNQDSTTGTPFTGAYKHLGYKEGIALPSNVIELPAEGAGLHSAPFPVGLPEFFIKAYSEIGDIWLDPFTGSGTTIIAAENLGRQCRAIEISPAYCAVILDRYERAFAIKPEPIP